MEPTTFRASLIGAAAIVLLAGAAVARPDYTYTGAPVEIPDGSGTATPGAAAAVTVSVTDAAAITHVRCSIYVPHGFQGDLLVTLTHVDTGHTATLIDRPYVPQTPLGFPAPDYGTAASMMQFDDTGASVYDVPNVVPPGLSGVGGVWKPQVSLAAFNGESGLGTWRLSATDFAGGDTGSLAGFTLSITTAGSCYANCDSSTIAPTLNINDFQCFLNKFASSDAYANCDASTAAPVLNVNDFQCFLNRFAAGCGS